MTLAEAATRLGVRVSATPEEVKAAFRKRAFEVHPDRARSDSPDYAAEVERLTGLSQQLNLAREVFDKHFAKIGRGGAGEESGSLLGRKLRASREHVRRQVDKPYYGGEVVWPDFIPKWEQTKNSAVIGLRSDGQVDLLVNNTYITTLSSFLGVVEHLKEIIGSQPGADSTSWEGYIVYLARQSTGEVIPVGLRNFWERVMFEESGVLHAADLRKAGRSTPDDFS